LKYDNEQYFGADQQGESHCADSCPHCPKRRQGEALDNEASRKDDHNKHERRFDQSGGSFAEAGDEKRHSN